MKSGQGFRRFGQHKVVIGRKLLALRQERGMTQGRLAALIGVSTQQVCEYERGSNNIPFEAIILISDILSAPLDYFRPHPGDDTALPPRRTLAGRPSAAMYGDANGADPLLAALRRVHP